MSTSIELKNKYLFIWINILAILFIAIFHPIIIILTKQWYTSEDYSHAFLALPVITYMVWGKRNLFACSKGCDGNQSGLFILLFSLICYSVAIKSKIDSFASVSMIFTFVGLIIYFYGYEILRNLSVPFILLLLLIPVPPSIYSLSTLPLQLKVSQISEFIIGLLNIPIFREGNVLTTPEKTFQVVQACSGMRSIVTLLTLSLMIGYFTLRTKTSKVILLLFSILVAVFVNVVRVVFLIVSF